MLRGTIQEASSSDSTSLKMKDTKKLENSLPSMDYEDKTIADVDGQFLNNENQWKSILEGNT